MKETDRDVVATLSDVILVKLASLLDAGARAAAATGARVIVFVEGSNVRMFALVRIDHHCA